MAHQVGDRLAAVLLALEAEQGFGGAVPPLQVALAVEHDHRVLERRGGLLHAVDHRLQAAAGALVALLQVVDGVEHLAPHPGALRRQLVGTGALQPVVQAQQLAQVPVQVGAQAGDQGPGVLAGDQAEQQAGTDQQQQAADENAAPVLFHLAILVKRPPGRAAKAVLRSAA
ncbi:hypothetical protein D3C86_1598420 [compost metagenome]